MSSPSDLESCMDKGGFLLFDLGGSGTRRKVQGLVVISRTVNRGRVMAEGRGLVEAMLLLLLSGRGG